MRNAVLLSAIATTIFGCAGNFKTDQAFQAYIADLQLSQLSVKEASAKLVSKGFACQTAQSAASSEVTCIRGTSGQQQAVRLSPSPEGFNHSTVVATLTFIAA